LARVVFIATTHINGSSDLGRSPEKEQSVDRVRMKPERMRIYVMTKVQAHKSWSRLPMALKCICI